MRLDVSELLLCVRADRSFLITWALSLSRCLYLRPKNKVALHYKHDE
jgi:hypothetical protein